MAAFQKAPPWLLAILFVAVLILSSWSGLLGVAAGLGESPSELSLSNRWLAVIAGSVLGVVTTVACSLVTHHWLKQWYAALFGAPLIGCVLPGTLLYLFTLYVAGA